MYEMQVSPKRDANEHRYGAITPCAVCAKPIDTSKQYFSVHFGFGGWYAVTEEENETEPSADLGWWPVGSDCLRKQPELKKYGQKITPAKVVRS